MTNKIIHLHANRPVIKAEIKPSNKEMMSKFSKFNSLYNSDLAILPRINGITIIKENLAAFSLSIPIITADAMVAPLLDIPGKIAIACTNPIKKLFLKL